MGFLGTEDVGESGRVRIGDWVGDGGKGGEEEEGEGKEELWELHICWVEGI